MDFTGLPDDNNENGLDITGLPDTNAAKLRQQYRATTASPDDAAKVFDITKRTGIPKPVVERNRPHAEKLAVEPDWDSIEAAAPVTARELAANAKLFELANDDTDNLTQLETAMRSNGQPVLKASREPETSFGSVVKGQLNVLPFALDRMRQGIRLELADLFGFDTVKQDALRNLDRANFRESLVTPEIQNTAGRWIYGGAANIQRVVPSIAAGIATRSPTVGLAAMGIQVQPETYGKYRARGGTPGEAALGSGVETGIEIGTEMLPMGFLVDRFGKAGAKEFIAGYLGRELPTELVAEISQGAVDTAIANPDKTWGQWADELPDTIGQTVVSTLMLSGGLAAANEAARRLALEQDKANAATQDAAALQNIAQLAAASKLRARDPQTFAEFTAAVTEDGAVQDIYLDPRALQQSGVDLEALAQVSPSVAAQYSEALATGGDIIIPVQEYASSIAGSQLDAVLTPHLRSASDALSLNEAQQFYQTQAEEFRKAATQVMEERAQDTAWQQSAKAVETKLGEQLQGAGRFTPDVNNAYAALMRDFYVTTASRMGITPEEMYARYPLQVRADRAKGAAVMDQGVSAEETIRAAFRELPSVSLGVAYPITVSFNGRTQQFMARQDALSTGKSHAAIHLTHVKRGRLLAGDPEGWIAQGYKLDGKNRLAPEGLPMKITDEEAAQFNANFEQQQPEPPSFLAQALKTVTDALGITQQEQAETIDVDGVARPVQNSNGQRIAQTEEGLRNFWRWFGDSKVVDEQGRPLVVYHGTNTKGITEFRPGLRTNEFGMYTTPTREFAESFAQDDGEVMPLYIKSSNLLDIEDLGAFVDSENVSQFAKRMPTRTRKAFKKAFNDLGKQAGDAFVFNVIENDPAVKEAMQSDGIDGLRFSDWGDGSEESAVVVFDPTQIKSAVGNQGTFDPQDANILNQSGLDMGQFFQSVEDYGGDHRPPGPDGGAPLHDLTGEGNVYPDDVYGPNAARYYGHGEDALDRQTVAIAQSFKGKPNAKVTIYRAIPDALTNAEKLAKIEKQMADYMRRKTVPRGEDPQGWYDRAYDERERLRALPPEADTPAVEVNPGDWVTINKAYAKEHGESALNGEYKIISKTVKASEVFTNGDSIHEWGYWPNDPNIYRQPVKGQENNRGEISFGADITKQPSVITLFKTADLSTFLHEMGHFQLEVLAHIASQPNAPAEIVSDMEKVLGWFGVADIPTWNAMSLEEKRPFHEQFARGFEAYLFEGKAPTPELASLFARFRSWLVNVYKSIKALRVDISDELRGVFDRMVATEDAIREAEALRAYAPLFTGPDQVGDPQLWNDLQSAGAEATQTALDALQKRSLRDMQWLNNARSRLLKQMQRDAKEKRSAVEAEVRAEVEDMPVYKVMRFLRTGEMTAENGDKIKADIGYRLDTDALAEMYPETMLARPALEKLRGMTRKEGLHPDLVAQMFGYTSGDHLVRELVQAEPMAELIEGMTDQRTLERYGDLSSPDVIARAVDEAIHNDARAMFVATELKALTKATGPVRVITKAAKAYAEAMIARKKVRDIKPNQYTTAETRAAKAAQKALQAGDTAMAASEKRNQLVQNYSARAAYDALDEVEKVVRYLRKFDNEGTRKNLDADYLDQIDALLERFDFRAITNKAADKRASLMAWVEAQRAQGFDPDIPDDVLSEAMRKPYRELTMEELRGVVDSVKQIEHFGRKKKEYLTAKGEREFAKVEEKVVNSIRDNAKKTLPEQRSSDRGFLVKASSMFRTAMAIHRKFSSLARGFDGFKDGGPAWEYLVRNMNERGDFEAVENEKATMALTPMLLSVTDKANGKLTAKQYFPTLGKSFSREERISFLLNMGNEANLERLLTGERLAPAQLQEVVGTLTKADAEFANQVWDYLDSFWPQVAEKQRRLTGKTPEKVEAVPFTLTLATGETVQMRGGYYPIAYDPLRSERSSADLNAEVARQIQQGLYTQAQTRRGHTKARSDSTGRPLRYDFGEVISRHVTQVIHDLAWHEYLIDANRLLGSQAIENAVRQHYGIETLKEMKDTLRDIAIGNMGMEKGAFAWNHLRYGTTISALAFNVFNTLQNITGITQSMSRIGTKWVFKGAAHWAGDIARLESSVAEIHEKSDFMRLRAKTLQREINEIRNKVSGNDSKLQASFFYLQSKTQLLVDVPTWWGAYEKAMSMDEMTEDKAVALADQAVIDAQGSGQVKDLAGIQRGGAGMKLFTSFYSFFNQTFNLTAEAYGRTNFKKPSEVALFTADMVLLYTLPALLSTLLKAAMEDDWDDEDKLAKKVIGDQISFMLGTVVGLRELSAAGKEAAGVGDGFGYTGPASVRFFSDAYRLGQQISQGEADEPFWKALNNTAGVLFHYPAGQINRTATGIVALSEGRTDNPLAVVMGAPKD